MSNANQTPEIFIAAEAVSYSSQSVVSKTLYKNNSGNITLFAFDKGEGLAEHTTPHQALVQVLDGTAEITIGGNTFTLQTGGCIFLPANVPHALVAVESFKMMLTMIKN